MRILIEEYSYDLNQCPVLKETLHGLGLDWNTTRTGKVSLSYVGYFYNPKINDCVFILPKVLLKDGSKAGDDTEDSGKNDTVFGKRPEDIIKIDDAKLEKEQRDFIYEFAVWIYRAIVVYQKDNKTNIIRPENVSQISRTKRHRTNTMLDVILSLIQFSKDHQDFITFTLRNIHSGYNKINWTRTINRSQAIIQDGCPVYLNPVNKKRQINFDEELLIIFYSILNYIKGKYGFHVNINVNFPLIKGAQFESYIQGRGVIRLRQIKYKYYSDIALELWELCNAFFDRKKNINSSAELADYLLAKNFYIVFEAMIDELVGSKDEKAALPKELSDQKDGKIVDHLYTYPGLMEAGQDVPTYYIGDSKYYKIGNNLQDHSIYKQNTYARNIIQYNLDLWDKGEDKQPIRLRDQLTEGYNILPNFFISASMKEDDYSYTHDQIERREGGTQLSYQFRDRLFDRDTLLLSHYNVNFLFVVALYARDNASEKNNWKDKVQAEFRQAIQNVLRANYDFFALQPKAGLYLEQWINRNFKDIHGKIFRPYEDQDLFILAIEKTTQAVQEALHGAKRKPLEQIETTPQVSEKEEQEAQDLRTKLERAFVVQPVDKLDAPLDVAIEEAAKVAVGVAKQEIIASGVLMIFMESYDKKLSDFAHGNIAIPIKANELGFGIMENLHKIQYVLFHTRASIDKPIEERNQHLFELKEKVKIISVNDAAEKADTRTLYRTSKGDAAMCFVSVKVDIDSEITEGYSLNCSQSNVPFGGDKKLRYEPQFVEMSQLRK